MELLGRQALVCQVPFMCGWSGVVWQVRLGAVGLGQACQCAVWLGPDGLGMPAGVQRGGVSRGKVRTVRFVKAWQDRFGAFRRGTVICGGFRTGKAWQAGSDGASYVLA